MSFNLLVIDDHEVARCGVRVLLRDSEIVVAHEAGTADEGVEAVRRHQPDLVLLDIRMTGTDGLTCLGRIKLDFPDTPVVMFTAHDSPTYIARSVALGASGYLTKSATRNEMIRTLTAVASGEDAWAPEQLRRITGATSSPRPVHDLEVPLTCREMEVLRQMSLGLTNKEIAKVLTISYETVKEHVQHILRKLSVSDRTQAAVWAVRKGLV